MMQRKRLKKSETFHIILPQLVRIVLMCIYSLPQTLCDISVSGNGMTEVCETGCPCSYFEGTLKCILPNTLDRIPRLSDNAMTANVTQM